MDEIFHNVFTKYAASLTTDSTVVFSRPNHDLPIFNDIEAWKSTLMSEIWLNKYFISRKTDAVWCDWWIAWLQPYYSSVQHKLENFWSAQLPINPPVYRKPGSNRPSNKTQNRLEEVVRKLLVVLHISQRLLSMPRDQHEYVNDETEQHTDVAPDAPTTPHYIRKSQVAW